MNKNGRRRRVVFISYSSEDRFVVLPIVQLLKAAGADVFLDFESIPYGDRWEETLFNQLRSSDRILVFWSRKSAESEWVRTEYTTAINLGLRVIPVLLDETPLAAELSLFQALDTLVHLFNKDSAMLSTYSYRDDHYWRIWPFVAGLVIVVFVASSLWLALASQSSGIRLIAILIGLLVIALTVFRFGLMKRRKPLAMMPAPPPRVMVEVNQEALHLAVLEMVFSDEMDSQSVAADG